MEAGAYWRTPLTPIMTSRQLTEYYVLDAEEVAPQGQWGLAPVLRAGCCRHVWRVCACLLMRAPQRQHDGGSASGAARRLLPGAPPHPPSAPPLAAGNYGHSGRWGLAACEVARAADFGSNDRTLFTRTHLGHLLHAGDTAVGYDTGNANLVSSDLELAVHKVRAQPCLRACVRQSCPACGPPG